MKIWIETKLKFSKTMENGEVKKVTEQYLVDALSFAEAEERIIKEATAFIHGDFTVEAVKKSNISEIFYDERGDKWYKVKTAFITLDEKTGQEKKSNQYMMVQAPDFHNALENFIEGMKGTMSDFEIASIAETKIIDVYDFEQE